MEEIRYIKKFSQKIYTDTTTSSDSVTLYCTDKLTYDGKLGTGNYYKVQYGGKRYFIYTTGNIDECLGTSLQDIYNGIEEITVTSDSGTNIYAKADKDSNKLQFLNSGDTVTVLSYSNSGNWAYVKYGSVFGYVLTKKF